MARWKTQRRFVHCLTVCWISTVPEVKTSGLILFRDVELSKGLYLLSSLVEPEEMEAVFDLRSRRRSNLYRCRGAMRLL